MTSFIIDPMVMLYHTVFVCGISFATMYGWNTYQAYRRKQNIQEIYGKLSTFLWDTMWKSAQVVIPSHNSEMMTEAIHTGFQLLKKTEHNSKFSSHDFKKEPGNVNYNELVEKFFHNPEMQKIVSEFQKEPGNVNYNELLEKLFHNPEIQMIVATILKTP